MCEGGCLLRTWVVQSGGPILYTLSCPLELWSAFNADPALRKCFSSLLTVMSNCVLSLLIHLTEHDKLVLSIVLSSNNHFPVHYHDYMTREENKES